MSDLENQQGQHRSEPIELADLDRIRDLLADRPRDLLLLELTVQSSLPVKRLLQLKTADLIDLKPNDRTEIENNQSRAVGVLVMSESLYRVWSRYLDQVAPAGDDYIFKSQKGTGPLKLSSVSNLVNEWFESAGLHGPRGLRSLQATHRLYFADSNSDSAAVNGIPNHLKGLKPVRMVSAQEVVYRGLFQAIISGTIPPGEPLIPEKIAAQMNVSRMPVREALQRLRAAGFVSIRARGRIVVNRLSRNELEEIQHIRLILEREAAHKAAVRRDEASIHRLETIHNSYEPLILAGRIEQSVKYNKDFHMTIYAQAGMPTLARMIEGLLDKVSPYLNIELSETQPSDRYLFATVGNHVEMINGMRERDPDRVVHYLTLDHNETTRRIVQSFDEKA